MKLFATIAMCLPSRYTTASAGGHGLIGYEQWWYDPKCCYSCRGVITSAPLDCPADTMAGMDMGMDMGMGCEGLAEWKIEQYCGLRRPRENPSIAPNWTYGTILENITESPDRVLESGEVLNFTAVLSTAAYEYQLRFNELPDWEEMLQSTYVIIIITVGIATPVLVSVLGHFPYMTNLIDRVKPYLVYPSVYRTYNVRHLPHFLRNAPTEGRAVLAEKQFPPLAHGLAVLDLSGPPPLGPYISTGGCYTDVHKPYLIWERRDHSLPRDVALSERRLGAPAVVRGIPHPAHPPRRFRHRRMLVPHILYWKPFSGIYEYSTGSTWSARCGFFDRLARVLRIGKNDIRRATVTEIAADTVRVDIEGVKWASRPGYHAYAYFPTPRPLPPLGKSTWLHNPHGAAALTAARAQGTHKSAEIPIRGQLTGMDSVTVYVKRNSGMSGLLADHSSLPVLPDGPYRGNPTKAVLKCDRVLSTDRWRDWHHRPTHTWAHAHGDGKLGWSVKQTARPVVHGLRTALDGIAYKEVLIDERLNVEALLEREEAVFELEVDAFVW
ncbi:ferric reductase like transmembrane component-domain-containing protein [Xylariomycetidae sp. FL2044]|nr:ferric reductase like transmembrane component-domain-containing protein [Xylariomycetidae sp. FL2044]